MSIGEWRDAFEIHFGELADRRWLETPFVTRGSVPGRRSRKPTPVQVKRAKARKAQKLARKRSRK